jgi:hypothetical protein
MSNQQEYIKQGDSVAAIIDILSNATEVQAFNCKKISANLVGYDGHSGDRWIVVDQHGGTFRFPFPAHPRIDIECYAEKRSVAMDMINTCIAVVHREQSNYNSATTGVRLCAAQIETAPFGSSDKDTDQIRYITALRLIVRPYTP